MTALQDWFPPPVPRPHSGQLGIGCLGAGFIMADCHLPAYRQAGFRPVAIAARRLEQAQQVAQRHQLSRAYSTVEELLADPEVQLLDIAVPPDVQLEMIRRAVRQAPRLRGILAQKPLGANFAEACEAVRLCADAGVALVVNQNMRYDQSVRAAKALLEQQLLGEPVLATIDMRAIPHWMSWQERQGWVTLRIMSIHHLDTFRYWLGDPIRVFASVRPDPRTAQRFAHTDGICLYVLEFANGARALGCDDVWTGPAREGSASDIGIHWRIEGTTGLARGTIGWPSYPQRTPSTLDFSTTCSAGVWHQPRWEEVWFPDAFSGPMSELLRAVEEGHAPHLSGADNLRTMALVEACYRSAAEHRTVELAEILDGR